MNSKTIWKNVSVYLTVIIAALSLSTTSVQTKGSQASRSIADLAWMSGSWQTAAGGRAQVEEHWMRPAGGSMIGMGRTIVGNRTVEFEFLRIEERGDAIYYVASPNAQCPSTDFKLTRSSGQEAVFENPQHDFPKRIIYRKNTNGSLIAIVDGGEGTKSQKFVYLPIAR